MTIRPYRAEDLPVIVDIANRAWRPINAAYRAEYGDELFAMLFPTPDTRAGENVRRDIEARPDQTIVVEHEGRVVGFCNYWTEETPPLGVVGYNAVDPDAGLKGVGQQMYARVLGEFRRRGLRYARVLTGLDAGHAPARRAYERAGFSIGHGAVTLYARL